jgi:sugar phosphate isomerase/epimerase
MPTMTRREFAGSMASVVISAGAVSRAQRKLNLGIGSYTYHSLSIDQMIVQLKRLQVSEIELSHGEFMLFSRPTAEKVAAVKAQLDRAGIACVSYYTATIKTDAELESALRFAALLGAKNVTGDATGDILKRIDQRFAQEGRTFGIHNHYFKEGFAYESPDDVLRALSGVSLAVGASLDIGHIASCGYDTVAAVHALASRLKMVHLKDVAAKGGEVNVLLGRGIARIPAVMKALRDVDYRGLVAIEYEKDGPVDEDVRIEMEYARKEA